MPEPVPIHEAADIFPLDEESIPKLADDIRKHGLHHPVERLDGKVIDGRRRLRACELAKVTPKFKDIETDDPIGYVLSLNLERRHLTTSQAATCAARAGTLRAKLEDEAKARQRAGGKAAGKGRPLQVRDNCPEPNGETRSRDRLGAMFGVSGKSVERAEAAIETGIPELIKAMDAGNISVNKAAYIATLDESTQAKVLAQELSQDQKPQRTATPVADSEEEKPEGELRGKGVFCANEAINCLRRIPKNDALRKRGFQIVKDWLRHNL